jgi:hypothetical protein
MRCVTARRRGRFSSNRALTDASAVPFAGKRMKSLARVLREAPPPIRALVVRIGVVKP